MAYYTDASLVTPYSPSGNPWLDSLLYADQWNRYAWTAGASGKTLISYSLPWTSQSSAFFTNDYGGEPTAATRMGLDAAQQAVLAQAFASWQEVANVQFAEIGETIDGTVGDIRVAFSSGVGEQWWGWTRLVGHGAANAHGDIWINPIAADAPWTDRDYNLSALVHEIGHALGLDHPFEGTVIPPGFDNRRYTIMSYTDPENVFWWNPATSAHEFLVVSPMVYDILAIQHLYGPNMEFHAGDDSYAFDSSVPFFKAIWDAGGSDTIDLSSFAGACTVNLEPGSYSTLGFQDLAVTDNLGIAFDCWIENARGGAGNDTIAGNALANVLYGNRGSDRLLGSAGNDRLEGEAGSDRLYGEAGKDLLIGGAGNDVLSGGNSYDTAQYSAAGAGITVDLTAGTAGTTGGGNAAGIGTDRLSSIENITGGKYADTLRGSIAANTLKGAAGDDVLEGLGQNDTLDGGEGDDRLEGGSGSDTALYSAAAAGVIVNLAMGTASSAGAIDAARIGRDTLVSIENATGGGFSDRLTGNGLANTLFGRAGNDILSGGAGADRLSGDAGNDRITGGAGRDTMTGGAGADLFLFDDGDFEDQGDGISDFNPSDRDRIDLSRVDANTANGPGDDAFRFVGMAAFSGSAGELRYERLGPDTFVSGDVDGDGSANFSIQLGGLMALTAADFVL